MIANNAIVGLSMHTKAFSMTGAWSLIIGHLQPEFYFRGNN